MAQLSLPGVLVGVLACCSGLAMAVEADSLHQLRAGTSIRSHSTALHSEMHRMMQEEDDDVDFHLLSHSGKDASARRLLEESSSGGTDSMDDYIRESEEGLSAALGPRWDGRALEEDANRKTQALLRGISGPRATGAIHRLMSTMSR
eukprot:CAMPEP_0179056198 /NCGR_PEP_ID=MMETSP0796-20121207/23689_1 /TAXON_ID=73915 /ORGANISM="Pyrodinium bahamense, Strain pbaha01" /LENGTH=146 /DNA_ID=CAMNT_0020752867 /DNA_START=107 /DNA_END=547 /DNA_ORIENTATION=-